MYKSDLYTREALENARHNRADNRTETKKTAQPTGSCRLSQIIDNQYSSSLKKKSSFVG